MSETRPALLSADPPGDSDPPAAAPAGATLAATTPFTSSREPRPAPAAATSSAKPAGPVPLKPVMADPSANARAPLPPQPPGPAPIPSAVPPPGLAPPVPGADPDRRIRPVALPARVRKRHWGLVLTFVAMVLLPIGVTTAYLELRAADQYASTLGFTVRSEETSSAMDLLGGLSSFGVGGSGSRDSDILYEFIRGQEMVAAVDAKLDLRKIYSEHSRRDPVFGLRSHGTIEDLTDYWQRMVRISYDASSGMMEVRCLAFSPEDARAIAQVIYDESTRMINDLSTIAREDATRYAREELGQTVERVKSAREALTAFRVEHQIVDVSADIQGQMGLLNTLQGQLAEALIELDLLRKTARDGDPRMVQAERRIEVIESRIDEERRKFSSGGPGTSSYAATVGEFERLTVDREFAERAYLAARSAYDAAQAEASRQSRYLAAYIRPSLAQRSDYPQRGLIISLVALFSFLIWSILILVYYSLRDRR